ncbi:MAG: hypothetical protein J6U24_07815 [Paludibacteraceae bacterium]|nr:hypothetical protein [Paludibacteraceae bacterium]
MKSSRYQQVLTKTYPDATTTTHIKLPAIHILQSIGEGEIISKASC